MTDVAYVEPIYLPVNQLTCSYLSSFGGGSEMLRDGDNIGILDTLARAQRYYDGMSSWADFLSILFCYCPYRTKIFMSHVPWLGATILSYPRLTPDFKAFRMYARERAARRIKEGSPYKDLFYHLVCDIVHLPAGRILIIRRID